MATPVGRRGVLFEYGKYFAAYRILPARRFLALSLILFSFWVASSPDFLCTRESGVVFICFLPSTPGWSCVFSRTRWSFLLIFLLSP